MKLSRKSTLQQVLDGTPIEEKKEVELVGACASICDPDTYPSQEDLDSFPKNLAIAVGFHPRYSYKSRYYKFVEEHLEDMEKLLSNELLR